MTNEDRVEAQENRPHRRRVHGKTPEEPEAGRLVPFQSSFMALGDGRHKLPVKEAVRAKLRKRAGDTIKVELRNRLS